MSIRDELIRRGIIVPAEARIRHRKTLPLEGAPMSWASGKSLVATLIETKHIDDADGKQAYGWLTAGKSCPS